MSSLEMLESDEQLDKMFTEVDVDGSGEIDFNEFLQMMASAMPGKDDDDARGDEMKAASIRTITGGTATDGLPPLQECTLDRRRPL